MEKTPCKITKPSNTKDEEFHKVHRKTSFLESTFKASLKKDSIKGVLL